MIFFFFWGKCPDNSHLGFVVYVDPWNWSPVGPFIWKHIPRSHLSCIISWMISPVLLYLCSLFLDLLLFSCWISWTNPLNFKINIFLSFCLLFLGGNFFDFIFWLFFLKKFSLDFRFLVWLVKSLEIVTLSSNQVKSWTNFTEISVWVFQKTAPIGCLSAYIFICLKGFIVRDLLMQL